MNAKSISIAKLDPIYSEPLKDQLRKSVSQYGEFKFEDDVWYCSKKHKNASPKATFTIKFTQVLPKYRSLLKYFALMSSNSINSICKKVNSISKFLDYVECYYPLLQLSEVNRKILVSFEEYLRIETNEFGNNLREVYNAVHDFFKTMSEFPELPSKIPTKRRNPFPFIYEKNDSKYIPKDVAEKWDKVMKDEDLDIPLEIRTIYWLIRSFPNRITEVLSLKQNCIKALYSYYVLSVPTYKQNGGYEIEEIKTIPINNTNHGNYIISLIKRLQEQTKTLLQQYPVFDELYSDYLFLTTAWGIIEEDGVLKSRIAKTVPKKRREKIAILLNQRVNDSFEKIANILQITDSEGNIYSPTSHQFRHNSITDRLYIGGHTFEQTTLLSGHKGISMPMAYAHRLEEEHKAKLKEIEGFKSPEDSPVEFKGRIMNLDEKTVNYLSRNPRAYLTWEANGKKGVGICSDILGCNPKGTSVHFECYACEWFVPKAEYMEDYKAEQDFWRKILNDSANNPKRAAHYENSFRNVELLDRIIRICENGVERYKAEIQQKVNQSLTG